MEKRDDFYIPEEMAEWIGLKKSEYLSRLIQIQDGDDIGFEEFHLYDSYIVGTIESPDKTFERDEDNQRIRTYLKSYSERPGFHQVVVGVLLDDQSKAVVFIPILSFVSKKDALVREFCQGEVLKAPTLN
ncbi:MAG: hypothetical protein ACLGHN_00565 [Bacteriovoracia bacterium]